MGCTLAAPRILSTMKKGPKKEQSWEKIKKKKGKECEKTYTHTK